jgi:uncharacterized protein (DUF433 family)
MKDETLLKRIEINPEAYKGKPVIKGTRVTLEIILNSLSQCMCYEFVKDTE